MESVLTEAERRDLGDVARRFLVESDARDEKPPWSDVVDLGWTSLGVPEELGGAGYGHRARSVIAQAAGETLGGGWLWPTLGLALPVGVAVGDRDLVESLVSGTTATVAWHGGSTEWLSGAISSPPFQHHAGTVSGTANAVPWARNADMVIVPASDHGTPGLWALPSDAMRVISEPSEYFDRTCPVASVELRGEATELARGDAAVAAWECAGHASAIWLAAESLGLAIRMLDLAVDHARERSQFGRPIGSFQAVSHPLAELYADIALARSAVDWAAEALDRGHSDAPRAVLTASALTQRAAVGAAEQAIQVLGGVGMTWESPVHKYLKRALTVGAVDGGPRVLRQRLADLLFDVDEASS